MYDRADLPVLYLASASPRRRELLEQIGVAFHCHPVYLDESVEDGEGGRAYAGRLALAKAQRAACELPPNAVVLGADTAVICGQTIFGKPRDVEDAVRMLQALSGRTHEVVTALALGRGERWHQRLVVTEVTFRPLDEAECRRYWRTGEPADKAGAYAVQGLGAVFVRRIAGSYSAVVGLPLAETAELLREFGVGYWNQGACGET